MVMTPTLIVRAGEALQMLLSSEAEMVAGRSIWRRRAGRDWPME